MTFTFAEVVGAVLSVGIVSAVIYSSIVSGDKDATTALVGGTGVALGYWLRAKLQASTPDAGPPKPPAPPRG